MRFEYFIIVLLARPYSLELVIEILIFDTVRCFGQLFFF